MTTSGRKTANPHTMSLILRMIIRTIVVAGKEGRGQGQMTTGTIAGMIHARAGGNRRVEGRVVAASPMGAMTTSHSQMATTVISPAPSMMPRLPIRWKIRARPVICAPIRAVVQIGLIRAVNTLRATILRATREVVRVMTGSNSHQPGVRGDRGVQRVIQGVVSGAVMTAAIVVVEMARRMSCHR